MATEEQLTGWTGPSSDTEQDKQDRTDRMITDAVNGHPAFGGCSLSVYSKGSYANQTNVRADSDVDVVVQCHECQYWDEAESGARNDTAGIYQGIWTPAKLRSELAAALQAKFPGQVDASGSTAIVVRSSSARVDADVVPSFNYRYFFASGSYRDGTKVFKNGAGSVVNWPAQHLAMGQTKDARTNGRFKQAVRVLKRVENLMVQAGANREVPSYFMECLVYNVPDSILLSSTWTDTMKGVLFHVWDGTGGAEPTAATERWLEVNECKWLFCSAQKWTRTDGRDLAQAAWTYLGFGS